jgi:hypothetical protein
MADKRISQLIERTDIANNDVLPIVASGATTTNKVTVSTLQDWMQDNLDVGVTSVGLSVPSAFTVSGSPVTTSGNITISGAGTTAQYIRGDGSLADFPQSSGGGGASVSYYLNGSVSQGTIGGVAYREMNKTPIFGAGTDITINANGYIASFITDAGDPNLLLIPAGNWNFETYFSASSGGGSPTFYIELYKVSGSTATLIASNSGTPELIAFGTNINPYFSALAVPATTLALTDRLALRYYVTTSGRTITLHTENGHLCQIITTFTTGLTALNGLTAQVQNFATGTSGTDFNISSASTTHTFNIPDASASNRGAVTTGSQVFGGVKTFTNGFILPSAGGTNQNSRFVNIGTIHEGSAGSTQIGFNNSNNIYFGKGLSNGGVLQWTNAAVRYYTLPDADGTIALASQLDGYVTLGTVQTITGQKTFNSTIVGQDATLTNSGSNPTLLVTHSSGSGIALDISKGGNGEGLRVTKTSGSGNAVTITGGASITGLSTIQGTTASDSGQLGAELLTTGTGDASWTGTSFATGYTHVAGSTTTLTSTLAGVVNTFYQITYTVTGRTAGSFTIAFGGFTSAALTATGAVGPRATTTDSVVITPTSDFNGTIVLSIRVISASSASVTFNNSAGTVTNQIRISNNNSNTIIGNGAGSRNTTGSGLSIYGRNAGANNTTGFANSFFGEGAGAANTIGIQNSFFGNSAGAVNTTGTSNSFFGTSSGIANTTGVSNSFFGASAGQANTIGSSNSFFGVQAGQNTTTGENNTIIGTQAGRNATTGIFNTYIGSIAGRENGTGSNNVFIGRQSGTFLANLTALTIANSSVFLGFDTRANADNQTNQIVIGASSIGLGSNTTVLGNTSTTFGRWFGNLLIGDSTNTGEQLQVTGTAKITGAATFSSSVGIGISPATALDVNGTINVRTNGFQFGRITTNNVSGDTGGLNLQYIEAGTFKNGIVLNGGGNVGIGTASPGQKLAVSDSGAVTRVLVENTGNAVAGAGLQMLVSSSGTTVGNGTIRTDNGDNMQFFNIGGERMRITSGGNVLIGKTTLSSASLSANSTLQVNNEIISTGTNAGLFWENRSGGVTTTSNWYGWYTSAGTIFLYNGSANIASINATTGVYTPLSDINKKKDFEESSIGLNEVLQLKPTLYRIKDDESEGEKELGFIAQEVKEFIPQAYVESGEDDAKFIGLNYNAIVAALVKSIQELKIEIDSLKNQMQ